MGCRSLLVLTLSARFVIEVTNGQGLGFVLNGTSYSNGSTVLRTDIGEEGAALQCTTDRAGCCGSGRNVGQFYFPDGTQVPTSGNNLTRTYYRNRFYGGIRLNRRPNGTITGQFRCEIPDVSGTLVNLFINIVDPLLIVSITTSGTNTAGDTYSLVCSVTVTGSTNQPTITWLDPVNNTVPSEMVTTTGSMSTLTFNPLAASHAGTYACRATVTGNVMQTDSEVVYVEIPTPTVTINSSTIAVGSNVTLTCTVELDPAVHVPVTVTTEWTGPAGFMTTTTAQPVMGSTTTYTSITTVSSFGKKQSGNYTCIATVSSASLFITSSRASASTGVTVGITDQHVTFQLRSSPDSINISFSLICNSTGGLVDSLIWRRDGVLLDNTGPLVVTDASTFSFNNVLHVNSRTTGEYTCLTRGPNDELLNSTTFTVQAASPPVNVQACQSSASATVEVSWSPPSGGAAITGYRIFYHNQKNFVSSYVTSIVFNFIEIKNELEEILSIRSESPQLPSEPVNVRITNEIVCQSTWSSSASVAIVVGVIIALAALVVTNVIFFLCWLRRKKQSKKCEMSVSANIAYGQVNLEPGGGEYEDPGKMKSVLGNYELMQHSADHECSGASKQAAAVCITAKDTNK